LILGVIKIFFFNSEKEHMKTNYSLTRMAKLRLYNCCKEYAENAVRPPISFAWHFLRLIEINF